MWQIRGHLKARRTFFRRPQKFEFLRQIPLSRIGKPQRPSKQTNEQTNIHMAFQRNWVEAKHRIVQMLAKIKNLTWKTFMRPVVTEMVPDHIQASDFFGSLWHLEFEDSQISWLLFCILFVPFSLCGYFFRIRSNSNWVGSSRFVGSGPIRNINPMIKD